MVVGGLSGGRRPHSGDIVTPHRVDSGLGLLASPPELVAVVGRGLDGLDALGGGHHAVRIKPGFQLVAAVIDLPPNLHVRHEFAALAQIPLGRNRNTVLGRHALRVDQLAQQDDFHLVTSRAEAVPPTSSGDGEARNTLFAPRKMTMITANTPTGEIHSVSWARCGMRMRP